MRLGIFAKTFSRPSVEGVLDVVVGYDLYETQFNMSVTGLPSMPAEIASPLADRVREAAAERNLALVAVSGTFNMAHPNEGVRRDGLHRLGVIAGACQRLGTSMITLCTALGTGKTCGAGTPITGHQGLGGYARHYAGGAHDGRESGITLASSPRSTTS